MKVRYIRNDWNASKGTVKNVPNAEARLLVDIGMVGPVTDKPKRKGNKASA